MIKERLTMAEKRALGVTWNRLKGKSKSHRQVIPLMCKILDVHNRQLLSANPDHEPININPEDAFSIEGILIRSVRLHKPLPEFM